MKRHFLNLDYTLQGSLAILFASLLWGTTGTAASFAPSINPLAIGAFSMGIGGLLLSLCAYKKLHQDWQKLVQNKRVLLIGTLGLAVYPLAFYSSMRLAGVAVGTVVSIASAPFMTVMIERLFGKKQTVSSRWLLSFLLGTAGIALLTFAEHADDGQNAEQASRLLGILLGLVAGLSYSVYAWVAKRLIDNNVQSESAMAAIFGSGALLLLPSLVFTGGELFSSPLNATVSLYMALVPMFVGYLAFGFALRHVNASKATLLTLFEPVVAAVLAVVIVGELISVSGWAGMGLIMVCLYLQATEKQAVVENSRGICQPEKAG